MRLLHGTQIHLLPSILKEGLKPPFIIKTKSNNKKLENYLKWKQVHNYIYLTEDLLEAYSYAFYGSVFDCNVADRCDIPFNFHKGKPCVVVVDIPELPRTLEYKTDNILPQQIHKIIFSHRL